MDICPMCKYIDPITIENKPLTHHMAEYVDVNGNPDGVYNTDAKEFTIPKNEKSGKAEYKVYRRDLWKGNLSPSGQPIANNKPVPSADAGLIVEDSAIMGGVPQSTKVPSITKEGQQLPKTADTIAGPSINTPIPVGVPVDSKPAVVVPQGTKVAESPVTVQNLASTKVENPPK